MTHQDAWVSGRQHFLDFAGFKLTFKWGKIPPSTSRHVALLIRSGIRESLLSMGREHLGSILRTGILIMFYPKRTQSLKVIWVRYTLLNLWSKTRQKATLCFLPWFTPVDLEGRSTSLFHLWQKWRFQLTYKTFRSRAAIFRLRSSMAFISQFIRYARYCSLYGCYIPKGNTTFQ